MSQEHSNSNITDSYPNECPTIQQTHARHERALTYAYPTANEKYICFSFAICCGHLFRYESVMKLSFPLARFILPEITLGWHKLNSKLNK